MKTLGIKGEPKSGVLFRDKKEGIVVKFDANNQIIVIYSDNVPTDVFDCSYYENWNDVKSDFESNFGIKI